jgi:hypothetical protein
VVKIMNNLNVFSAHSYLFQRSRFNVERDVNITGIGVVDDDRLLLCNCSETPISRPTAKLES